MPAEPAPSVATATSTGPTPSPAPAETATATEQNSGTAPGAAGASDTPPSILGEQPPAAKDTSDSSGDGKSPTTDAPAPLEFDFSKVTLPEGMTLPDETQAVVKSVFTDPKLTPEERFSSLAKLYAAETAKATQAIHQSWHDLNNKWVSEIQADKDLGGERLTREVVPAVAKLLDTYGDPGVREALNLTGAGNHPAIIRTLYRAAKALTEGGHIAGSPPGTSAGRGPNLTVGAALYGPEGPKTSIRGA